MPIDAPAALVGAGNIVGTGNLHRTVYQGGAYREALIDGRGKEGRVPSHPFSTHPCPQLSMGERGLLAQGGRHVCCCLGDCLGDSRGK